MRNNSALVNLAIPVQVVKPIIIMTIKIEGFATTAAIEIIKNKRGIETTTSINLLIIISTGIVTGLDRNGIFFKK